MPINAEIQNSYKYIYEPGTIHIYENQWRGNSMSGEFCKQTYHFAVTMVLDVQDKGKGREVTLVNLYSESGPDITVYSVPYKVYEEDGVLYEYYAPSKLQPLIDMRAHKGDKISCYNNGKRLNRYYTVTDEDIIQVKGVERRRLHFEHPTSLRDSWYWIDGIGSDVRHKNLVVDVILTNPHPFYLVKCYQNDKCMLSPKDFYINTSIEQVDIDQTASIDAPIYDLMGRQVSDPQHGHLYIQNGKKILW